VGVNFDLKIGESRIVYLETNKKSGLRIVAQGRAGWGTTLTIKSAKPDVVGNLSWTLQQRFNFNQYGDMIDNGAGVGDPTAEALLLVLTRQQAMERELTAAKDEATRLWHQANPAQG
jgi:hypothetical protein